MTGPYELLKLIGSGGTGRVWRARDTRSGDVVAVKVLRDELTHDPLYRRRFEREARAVAHLRHRHLVAVLDSGDEYLVTELRTGGSLRDRLESPLASDDAVHIAGQVASGLAVLHDHGVVHRDVKPPNVLFDGSGSAAIGDFGLAKHEAWSVLTRTGQVMGTLDYIAPELVHGMAATPRSDVYALGCLVYETLAGQPPFGHLDPSRVASAHVNDDPPDLPDSVPRALAWATLRALEKDPSKRPPGPVAYANLLRSALGDRA